MTTNTYARIDNGAVAEILTLDASLNIGDCFTPGLVFVDVTNHSPMPAVTWVYSGGSFSAPPAPPAPIPPMPSPREWLERLSADKQAAITSAAMSNATLMLWLLKASGTSFIDVTAQETKDGVAALVTAGVITSADQTALLAP